VLVPSLAGFAAAPTPRWRYGVARVVDEIGAAGNVSLVAHSGAGLLVPAVAEALALRASAIVLVDTPVPPVSGTAPTAPPQFRAFLEAMADPDGWLPPWPQWWDDALWQELVPDPALRRELAADVERLPFAYFDEEVPAPAGWDDRPVAYIQLSPAYGDEAEAARRRGWPVERIGDGHLDIATRPRLVAPALVRFFG
jgi:hypothetical protein